MSLFQRLVIKLGSVKQVELADYSIADTTRRYFYSSTREDTLNGIETSVDSKDDLEKAIKEGKVYSYSERIIRFYFPNKEQV